MRNHSKRQLSEIENEIVRMHNNGLFPHEIMDIFKISSDTLDKILSKNKNKLKYNKFFDTGDEEWYE